MDKSRCLAENGAASNRDNLSKSGFADQALHAVSRLAEGETLASIARQYGVSTSLISRLHSSAMRHPT
jgi:hypothetical protein